MSITEPDLVKAARAKFRGIEGAPVTELAVRRMIRCACSCLLPALESVCMQMPGEDHIRVALDCSMTDLSMRAEADDVIGSTGSVFYVEGPNGLHRHGNTGLSKQLVAAAMTLPSSQCCNVQG